MKTEYTVCLDTEDTDVSIDEIINAGLESYGIKGECTNYVLKELPA